MSNISKQLLNGVLIAVEELEQTDFDLMGWLNEQLSIESVMHDAVGNFQGVEVLITCGGPDIRLNTRYGQVIGCWGDEHIERNVDCSEINNQIEELFSCNQ